MSVQPKVLVAAIFALTVLYVPSVAAESVRQWIAPPECVVDAGLATQYVLTEQQCHDLLNPPAPGGSPQDGSTGGASSGGSPSASNGSATKQPIPVLFLPVTATISSGAPFDALDGHPNTIRIDHAVPPRDGSRAIALLAVIYTSIFLLLIGHRIKRRIIARRS